MAATHPEKVGTATCLPHFLLITLLNHLGVGDTNCWSFASRIFAQSQAQQSVVIIA